ncbi:hypothetical protein Tco_0266574 [Tanacetum coccineum]
MSSITAQQTKLDLELVPKENRIDIRKCNGRIPCGLTPREPTFQVVMDAIALTPCYPAFLITADVPEVYMHQFWNSVYKHDTFYRFKIDKKKRFKLTLEVFRDIFQICPRVQGREFDPLPSEEDIVSFLRELGHTVEINSLNDVVVDQMHQPWRSFVALINRSLSGKTSESSQIYGAVQPECLTSPEMKESKAYKTYLVHATCVVPPKIARKFKKASPSNKDSILDQADEEPVQKGKKRVKRSAMKSFNTPLQVLFFLERLSESRTKVGVAKKSPSVEKITPTVTSEGTGDKRVVPDVTEDDSTKSESESLWNLIYGQDEENLMNDINKEEEVNRKENELTMMSLKVNVIREWMILPTNLMYVDTRLEEPTQTGKEVVQGEGADVEMIDTQQGNENLETTQGS